VAEAITAAGLEALRQELEQLETVARAEIVDRIRTAREWGDLKENAEYHSAKNDQGLLERRITMLTEKLREAVVVEATDGGDTVAFGSTVHVVDETSGRPATYTLVGSTEADAAAGKLSADSPVGRALVGARAGDVVKVTTPRGARPMRVVKIGA
jgi:transcription elongation factor GreA